MMPHLAFFLVYESTFFASRAKAAFTSGSSLTLSHTGLGTSINLDLSTDVCYVHDRSDLLGTPGIGDTAESRHRPELLRVDHRLFRLGILQYPLFLPGSALDYM